MRLKKLPGILLSSALGAALLFNFQNCAPGMKSSQQFQNAVLDENRKNPELDSEELGQELEFQAKAAAPKACYATDLRLQWPLGGTSFKDWVIVNYVDIDANAGTMRDYMGATGTSNPKALTYDGHRGIDIDVPSFRAMDKNFPVLAAAAGVVEQVYHGSPDRNLACSTDPWNVVVIKHSTGIRTIYGHLKRNSVVVAVGQAVVPGQKLGVVGSSGCSTYPHLHFEVVDCNGKVWDPVKLGMFVAPPLYTRQGPATVMDTVVDQPGAVSINQFYDPGVEPLSVKVNVPFTIGGTISSFKRDNVLRIDFFKPDGTQSPGSLFVTAPNFFQLSHWYWPVTVGQTGTWTAKFFLNNVQAGERKLQVAP